MRAARGRAREPVTVERLMEEGRRDAAARGAPLGALQLVLAEEPEPGDPMLSRLATFAVRAAHMLPRRRAAPVPSRRARAEPRAADDRRAGDLRALAGAHARHRSSPRLRAARGRSPRGLPARGRPPRRPPMAALPARTSGSASGLELALGPARGRGLVLVPTRSMPGSARSAAPSRSSGSRPCSAFPCAQVTS